MKKRKCCECGLKKNKLTAATVHVDGTISWVCKFCWERLGYGSVLKEKWE